MIGRGPWSRVGTGPHPRFHMSGFTANSGRHFIVEVEEDGGVLRKRKFRSRAHANPLADPQFEYPVDPDSVDWSQVYPAYCKADGGKMDRPIDFADIGCGFGGLLMELGKKFPDKVSIGIEIREKVSSYVDQVCALPPCAHYHLVVRGHVGEWAPR